MDTTSEQRPDTQSDLSPECKLAQLESQWLEAWELDKFGLEAAILKDKVLKARAGLPDEEEELPVGYEIVVTQRFPRRTHPMTHREEILGVDYHKPAGKILRKVQKLGGTAAAFVGIARS